MRLGLITILLCFAYSAIGQGTNEPVTFGGNTYNMIVYKPAEYADSIVKRYPAIIFFVGAGEVGTDAGKASDYGPNWAVKQGWNGQVIVGDSTFKCMVITFQHRSNFTAPGVEDRAVDTIINRYRVDTMRLYATGLSRGAQGIIRLMCDTTATYANRLRYTRYTAIVPMSEGKNIGGMSHGALDLYASRGGSAYVLRGSTDGSAWVTDSVTAPMNATRPGSAVGYDWTLSDASGTTHCCWNDLYTPSWTHEGRNIYQWMLGHSKRPYASASQATINTENTSITLNGIANQYAWGYNGWGRTTGWTKKSGGAATINSPNADTTAVTGLAVGTYVFTFKSENASGEKAEFDVTVNVTEQPAQPGSSIIKIKKKGQRWVVIKSS